MRRDRIGELDKDVLFEMYPRDRVAIFDCVNTSAP